MQYKTYHFDNSIREQLHALSELDNWHGLLALLEDYSLIALSAIATCYLSWYLYPLAILVIGSRQRALATLLHEASHKTLAKNKYLNFTLGTFFSGYLILQNMGSYRESHVRFHHGHFGDPNLDPDYQFALQQNLYDKTQTPVRFVIQNIILPCFLVKVPNYLYSLVQSRLLDKRNRKELVGAIAYLGILTAIFTSLGWGQYLILFWVVPYLTTFQIIGWFIELGEHYPLMNNKINLYMTRNRHGHWLEKLFTGMHNESYHLVHHLNPKIPFWNVAKVHNVYLQDENYAQFDRKTGGLFLSANSAPTILQNAIASVHSQWIATQQLAQ
ncbi:MAG: guanitoxin biosynthesis L-arginine gamma (S) hydroxylase [Cyanobacteria bacterium P01_E01_bin.42]